MRKANRAWIVMVALIFLATAYQNCGAAGTIENGETDVQIGTQSTGGGGATPTPAPTLAGTPRINPNPDRDGATPTPSPTATPSATPTATPTPTPTPSPTPTPTPTPTPVQTVDLQRYYAPSTGDHALAPVGSNVNGYQAETIYFKLYKNPGPNRQRLYQCVTNRNGMLLHMITTSANCESSVFTNPSDLGGYISLQRDDETPTIQVFRKTMQNNAYYQLPSLDQNEANETYPNAAGTGFLPRP